uniref:Uncharacterized protein n=1 Tax=Arundo donax TaxID=35708 RepID=A0A0A8Z9U4_ARUDO
MSTQCPLAGYSYTMGSYSGGLYGDGGLPPRNLMV